MATYHEIIIKGDAGVVDGYLKGFLAGRGVKSGFYFSKDWPFHLKNLRERFKYHGEVEHVICLANLRQTIVGSVNKSSAKIEVVETQKIESLSFAFDFKTANRQFAATIKRVLRALPDGVDIEDFEPVETVHPGARGAEGYAPLHHFEFEGKGVAVGDVEGILKLHKKLKANKSFHVEDIDINS